MCLAKHNINKTKKDMISDFEKKKRFLYTAIDRKKKLYILFKNYQKVSFASLILNLSYCMDQRYDRPHVGFVYHPVVVPE